MQALSEAALAVLRSRVAGGSRGVNDFNREAYRELARAGIMYPVSGFRGVSSIGTVMWSTTLLVHCYFYSRSNSAAFLIASTRREFNTRGPAGSSFQHLMSGSSLCT
jgi:hypothetical protein